MTSIRVSPKYQLSVPKEVRDRIKLRPGETLEVFPWDDGILYIRVPPTGELRGMLGGAGTDFERMKDRNL